MSEQNTQVKFGDRDWVEPLRGSVQLKVKLLDPAAKAPSSANPGDAGLDLTVVSRKFNTELCVWEYGFGIAVEIPVGHVGLIFPRSSIFKFGQSLTNCVGVIDSGYRGELKAFFREHGQATVVNKIYTIGERACQMIVLPYPAVEVTVTEQLDESARGEKGFGSSGRT